MNSLSIRSAKYYFIQGLKTLALTEGLMLLLVVEYAILGVERTDLVGYLSETFILFNCTFMIMFNMLYSLYGPNWYDGVVLSMGARRKDVFIGEQIKQLTYVFSVCIISVIASYIFKHEGFIPFIGASAVLGVISGAIGLALGYKCKKYGKAVLMIMLFAVGGIGGLSAVSAMKGGSSVINFLSIHIPVGISIAVAVVIYLGFEIWAYVLSKKSMVS